MTPLIRAQKVAAWREVARRLAHEIKNPLTPIQLSRRAAAPALRPRRRRPTQALVAECTSTIVGEVDSLKALVDEFSQFARMPAPRAAPADLHALLDDTLTLYDGLFEPPALRAALSIPRSRSCRIDPDQIKRVVINLVDNAIEALRARSSDDSHGIDTSAPTRPDQPRAARRSPTTARESRRPTATSSSCRTTRPSGAAAASAWPLSAASSRSTAARSRWATTAARALGSRSSCRASQSPQPLLLWSAHDMLDSLRQGLVGAVGSVGRRDWPGLRAT